MPRFVKLSGAARYGYRGVVYEKGDAQEVTEDLALYLLAQVDELGIPYFREVSKIGGKAAAARGKGKKEVPEVELEEVSEDIDTGARVAV